MQELIAKMRADWTVVAAHRVAAKEWTTEDEIEIGQAIKAAIICRASSSMKPTKKMDSERDEMRAAS